MYHHILQEEGDSHDLDQLQEFFLTKDLAFICSFPVTANSGSKKDIEEHIIEKLLIERMGVGLKPTITGSDPEPSNLHQKLQIAIV